MMTVLRWAVELTQLLCGMSWYAVVPRRGLDNDPLLQERLEGRSAGVVLVLDTLLQPHLRLLYAVAAVVTTCC